MLPVDLHELHAVLTYYARAVDRDDRRELAFGRQMAGTGKLEFLTIVAK